jgi:hypothetical protein
MGIFSDRCMKGDCPGRVPKTARFCRICGTPAPDADTNCGRCGATVAMSSKFCWSCGADLAQMRKSPLFGNRWVRGPDDFAIRVDEWDLKGFLTKGLNVEHGTTGMIFQQGRFCGYIESGSYDMNGFLKKLNHFNQTTPTSVVLVDVGDVELHVEAVKLRSKGQLDVDAILKAVVRLKDPDPFFTNAFKGRNHLTVGYLGNSLADELRLALQAYVGARPVAELYGNANLRSDVEQQVQSEMEPLLQRIGLELVQLRFVDFFCPTYDPIRQKEAELYIDTRNADIQTDRLKLTQRMRKTLTAEKMDELKAGKEFEDFVRQTEHEMGIKDMMRADEMDRLSREFTFTRDKTVLLQEIEIAGIRDEHERLRIRENLIAKIENENLQHKAELDQKLAQSKNDLEIKKLKLQEDRLESEQDFWEAEKAIELRRRSQLVQLEVEEKKQQIEAKTLEDRSKASAQALLSILDGPAADRIMRLEQLRAREKLSPDQIIAMTAADSPQVAQVLAEKYRKEAAVTDERFNQLKEFMARQDQSHKEAADRLERVMNVALQQMGATATTRAQAPHSSQTVVTPSGGMGAPVVIAPQVPVGEKPCPKCNKMIPSDSRFCPNCREKLS